MLTVYTVIAIVVLSMGDEEDETMHDVSTETLRRWIRDREYESDTSADPRTRREAQKMIDYFCKELGRRGEN